MTGSGADFVIGTRYEGPTNNPAYWFLKALGEVRRARVGSVRIEIETLGGGMEVGLLEDLGEASVDSVGAIELDGGRAVPCEDIAAFKLLPGPPLDRSDEIRGD